MLTSGQRILIIKWSSVGLLLVSVLPILAHSLFYYPILRGYLQIAILAGLAYFGYQKAKQIWEW